MADFIHPETGELLATEEQWREAIAVLERRLTDVYQLLAPLRNARAERFPPAELPGPRYRTQTQEKVARCPRCGTRLEEKDGE